MRLTHRIRAHAGDDDFNTLFDMNWRRRRALLAANAAVASFRFHCQTASKKLKRISSFKTDILMNNRTSFMDSDHIFVLIGYYFQSFVVTTRSSFSLSVPYGRLS